MRIDVHLHTILQQETPEGLRSQVQVDLPPDSTVGDLMAHLQVDLPPDALILAVNGRVADQERILSDGDEVHLMPAISGGKV